MAGQLTTSAPNSVNEITSQSGATTRTLSYDLNGSLTSNGGTRSFEWDGSNRLVAVNYTGTTQRSEFSYDGLSRCTKIIEKTGATVNSTRKFVWCGTEKCEYRNANNAVQLQMFPQGQYQSNAPSFYLRDHLGSIREMVDASGLAVARYDYDPWGRSTTVIGINKPDFNFTGLYQHAKSGLDMAVCRFYDPDLGRWLNRDPIGEAGGLNLYGYVENNPVNRTDPLGLVPDTTPGEIGGALTTLGNIYQDFRRTRVAYQNDPFFGSHDPERHFAMSMEMTLKYGGGITRTAGLINELQGLALFDLPALPARIRNNETLFRAFQLNDLKYNEMGILSAELLEELLRQLHGDDPCP